MSVPDGGHGLQDKPAKRQAVRARFHHGRSDPLQQDITARTFFRALAMRLAMPVFLLPEFPDRSSLPAPSRSCAVKKRDHQQAGFRAEDKCTGECLPGFLEEEQPDPTGV